MRQFLLAVPAVLAACTDAAEPTVDLSCRSELALTSLPSSFSGRVLDERGGAPIAFADVLLETGIEPLVATTDQAGRYDMAFASTAAPVAAARHAMANGYLDGYLYGTPSTEELLPMVTAADLDGFYAIAGVARDPYKSTLLIGAFDCAGAPIEGATIRAEGATGTLYLGGDTRFDKALTATSLDSAALVLNVPAGEVALEVEIDDIALSSSPAIEAHANALSTAWRRP